MLCNFWAILHLLLASCFTWSSWRVARCIIASAIVMSFAGATGTILIPMQIECPRNKQGNYKAAIDCLWSEAFTIFFSAIELDPPSRVLTIMWLLVLYDNSKACRCRHHVSLRTVWRPEICAFWHGLQATDWSFVYAHVLHCYVLRSMFCIQCSSPGSLVYNSK